MGTYDIIEYERLLNCVISVLFNETDVGTSKEPRQII